MAADTTTGSSFLQRSSQSSTGSLGDASLAKTVAIRAQISD